MGRMPSAAAHPIQTLREHATALEAALSVCLAEPNKRAVHKLRTETRRIEAQVALLKLMSGLPPFRAAAGKLLKQSKKLRRAAGAVRDMDVQHKLIKDEAETVTRDADDRATMAKRFEELMALRDDVRAERAKDLLLVLTERQAKVAGALEGLLAALTPALGRSLGATAMLALVDRAFRSTHELRLKMPNEDELHTIRKAAKQARYQMETASGSALARRAAKRYETLQDAGGLWHDWLDLAGLARKEFGEHHRITAVFEGECSRHLRSYERHLEEMRASLAAKPPAAKPRDTKPLTADTQTASSGSKPRKVPDPKPVETPAAQS